MREHLDDTISPDEKLLSAAILGEIVAQTRVPTMPASIRIVYGYGLDALMPKFSTGLYAPVRYKNVKAKGHLASLRNESCLESQ